MLKIDYKTQLSLVQRYCETEEYLGYDPFDALNSTLFTSLPLSNHYLPRLLWLQLFKHNPINLRRFVGVEKSLNPNSLGVFLNGYLNLYKVKPDEATAEIIKWLASQILDIRSIGYSGSCWGYDFPWQSRAFFFPKYTPTSVVSCFVANSLLDAYDVFGEKAWLSAALESESFVRKDLNRIERPDGFLFSYSPMDTSVVYNASALATRLLARIHHYTNENDLAELCQQSITPVLQAQNVDGSWFYGEPDYRKWIDSFHTAYILDALYDYGRFIDSKLCHEAYQKGLDFYREKFFAGNGYPRYYVGKSFPVDIICPAQFIISICRQGLFNENRDMVSKVLSWVHENLFNNKGYYYYRLTKLIKNRTSYMRWSNSWMFLALTHIHKELSNEVS